MADTPSADEHARFEKLMEKVLEPYKDVPKEVGDRIYDRLSSEFEHPKVSELEFLLQEKFTPEKARYLLFFPDPVMFGKFFPKLIADPPHGAPKTHPQSKMQVASIALLYLVHCQSWPHIKEFVLRGGLHQLVRHLLHPNLYIRSQVFEIINSITAVEEFDWFAPPQTKEDTVLHDRMLHIGDGLISRLIGNYSSSFPGGSHHALRLMAFWLSWSRKLYWSGRSPITTALIKRLEDWSKKQVDSDTSAEEVKLAKTLYDDFKRFGPKAAEAPQTALGSAAADALGLGEEVDPESPAEQQFRAAQGLTGPATKGFLNQKVLDVPRPVEDVGETSTEAPAYQQKSVEPASQPENTHPQDFIAAAQYDGPRAGFCFRKGKQGVGYYSDKNQPVDTDDTAAEPPATDSASSTEETAPPKASGFDSDDEIEKMRIAAPAPAEVAAKQKTSAPKPPKGRSEKDDIPDALNDSDDDSDFAGDDDTHPHDDDADTDDDLPEPSWKTSSQKDKSSHRESEVKKAKKSAPKPTKNERQPKPDLVKGLDAQTAEIMAQLLNRGATAWGEPVISSDEDEPAVTTDESGARSAASAPSIATVSVPGKEKKKKKDKKKSKKKKETKPKKKKDKEFAGFGAAPKAKKAPSLTKPPKSARTLETIIKSHASDEACSTLGTYFLEQVDPAVLPTLLATGFSNEGFAVILKVFEVKLLPEHTQYVVEFLDQFTRIPRFSVVAMMMSSGDRQRLERIWDIVSTKTKGQHPTEAIRSLYV